MARPYLKSVYRQVWRLYTNRISLHMGVSIDRRRESCLNSLMHLLSGNRMVQALSRWWHRPQHGRDHQNSHQTGILSSGRCWNLQHRAWAWHRHQGKRHCSGKALHYDQSVHQYRQYTSCNRWKPQKIANDLCRPVSYLAWTLNKENTTKIPPSYLIHSPRSVKSDADLQKAWSEMEAVKESGKARSIGVSNYLQHHLEATLATSRVPLASTKLNTTPIYNIKVWFPFNKPITISQQPHTLR